MSSFYKYIDNSRKNRNMMIAIFCVGFLVISVLLSFLIFVIILLSIQTDTDLVSVIKYNPGLSAKIISGCFLFVAIIQIIGYWKVNSEIKQGPDHIAKSLGATSLSLIISHLENKTTDDELLGDFAQFEIDNMKQLSLSECRKLMNVVEEMAIASTIPMPHVYVELFNYDINACAIGVDTRRTSICVTYGTLKKLTREELQGVIAHEFSHICNGDMRNSLKAAAFIASMTIIYTIGIFILRTGFRACAVSSSSRSSSCGRNKSSPLGLALVTLALGVSFTVFGLLGKLFGNIMTQAVSRRAEYLADATSVKYTRNPLGLLSALNKIAVANKYESANGANFSHLYFSAGFDSLFSSHPSIMSRIEAINKIAHADPSIPAYTFKFNPKYSTDDLEKPQSTTATKEQAQINPIHDTTKNILKVNDTLADTITTVATAVLVAEDPETPIIKKMETNSGVANNEVVDEETKSFFKIFASLTSDKKLYTEFLKRVNRNKFKKYLPSVEELDTPDDATIQERYLKFNELIKDLQQINLNSLKDLVNSYGLLDKPNSQISLIKSLFTSRLQANASYRLDASVFETYAKFIVSWIIKQSTLTKEGYFKVLSQALSSMNIPYSRVIFDDVNYNNYLEGLKVIQRGNEEQKSRVVDGLKTLNEELKEYSSTKLSIMLVVARISAGETIECSSLEEQLAKKQEAPEQAPKDASDNTQDHSATSGEATNSSDLESNIETNKESTSPESASESVSKAELSTSSTLKTDSSSDASSDDASSDTTSLTSENSNNASPVGAKKNTNNEDTVDANSAATDNSSTQNNTNESGNTGTSSKESMNNTDSKASGVVIDSSLDLLDKFDAQVLLAIVNDKTLLVPYKKYGNEDFNQIIDSYNSSVDTDKSKSEANTGLKYIRKEVCQFTSNLCYATKTKIENVSKVLSELVSKEENNLKLSVLHLLARISSSDRLLNPNLKRSDYIKAFSIIYMYIAQNSITDNTVNAQEIMNGAMDVCGFSHMPVRDVSSDELYNAFMIVRELPIDYRRKFFSGLTSAIVGDGEISDDEEFIEFILKLVANS